jgi:hypothetical protein
MAGHGILAFQTRKEITMQNENELADWLASSKGGDSSVYAIGYPFPEREARKIMDFAMHLWESGLVELVTKRSTVDNDMIEYIIIRRHVQADKRELFAQYSSLKSVRIENERYKRRSRSKKNGQ